MTSRVENNIKLLRKLIADFEVDYLISCSKLKKKNLETMIDFKNQEIKKLSTQLNNLRLDEKRNQQNQQMLNRELEFLVRPGKKKHSRRGFTTLRNLKKLNFCKPKSPIASINQQRLNFSEFFGFKNCFLIFLVLLIFFLVGGVFE